MVKFLSIYQLTKGTILNTWRKIEKELERRKKVLDLRVLKYDSDS